MTARSGKSIDEAFDPRSGSVSRCDRLRCSFFVRLHEQAIAHVAISGCLVIALLNVRSGLFADVARMRDWPDEEVGRRSKALEARIIDEVEAA